jgi:hypothetical protein
MASEANIGTEDLSRRWLGLGWHWLWFLPICVLMLALVERHTITYAFAILTLGWQRWSWGALFSPSALFCLHVVAASVLYPIFGLVSVVLLISARQPWRYSLLLILGIFVLPFIAEALMWGSFPFTFDDQGIARLRMIPFIPWPTGHYGEY